MKTIPVALAVVSLALALTLPASESDAQVVNGGFESGAFAPGWTVVDTSMFSNIGPDPSFAHSGTYHANLGATGTVGFLSQALSTTAGANYTLSFFLANDGGVAPNFFQAFFNGIPLTAALVDAPVFGYTQFFGNFLGTGAPGLLEFRYRNDRDFFRLDDVTVGVPEVGATAWLALPAFALLLVFHSVIVSRGTKKSFLRSYRLF